MPKFNNGQPYHGSSLVTAGRLRGASAESDYFYFFCPHCPGMEIVRILEYGIHAEKPDNPYNGKCKSTAQGGFTLVFKLHCDKCGHTDFVKVSNMAWQGGQYSTILDRRKA